MAKFGLWLTNQPGAYARPARVPDPPQTRVVQRARGPGPVSAWWSARVPPRCSQADAARVASPPCAARAAQPPLQVHPQIPNREPLDQTSGRRPAVGAVVDSIHAGAARFRAAHVDTMPVIEQAKGILMAQHECGPDEAFDLLRRASQRFNVPVRDLAARLVRRVQRLEPQGSQVLQAQVLHETPRRSHAAPALGALLDEVLEFALTLLHAKRGNVQLADPATGVLRIAAQRGFGPEFMEYFADVADDGSACGRAAREHAQVVITDITTDPGFAPHREIALASGFRAVQSTPLVNRAGQLVGMFSTHYPRPTNPPRRDLQIASRFGALAGESLSTLLNQGVEPVSPVATTPL